METPTESQCDQSPPPVFPFTLVPYTVTGAKKTTDERNPDLPRPSAYNRNAFGLDWFPLPEGDYVWGATSSSWPAVLTASQPLTRSANWKDPLPWQLLGVKIATIYAIGLDKQVTASAKISMFELRIAGLTVESLCELYKGRWLRRSDAILIFHIITRLQSLYRSIKRANFSTFQHALPSHHLLRRYAGLTLPGSSCGEDSVYRPLE